MRMFVALSLIALTLATAAPLAAAHVTKTVGAYSIKVGWGSEPPVAQERNLVTVQVSQTSDGAGVSDLASKLTLTVVLGVNTKSLALTESDEDPGNYSAAIIPTEPGLYRVRVQGFIGATQVSSEFEIEPVTDPADYAFPKAGSGGTGVTLTDLQNEFQQLRTDVDKLQAEQQKQANKIPGAGFAGAVLAIGAAAAIVAVARRR